jgi:acyl-CoA reductase-like NAD-dependent aldehyde dehydrogenase
MEYLHNYINGQFTIPNGEEVIENKNPADYREVVSLVKRSSQEDALEAVTAAKEAFNSWRKVATPERAEYLNTIAERIREQKERLATAIVKEMGKTYIEAMKEVLYAASIFQFYSGEGRRIGGVTIPSDLPNVQIKTVKEPIGVVLVITPWNFPLSIPAWKIAPAILCGNTIVLKPSSETPLLATMLMNIIHEVKIPSGVVNCVIGSGSMIDSILHEKTIKAISFTGSNQVGKHIYTKASESMKRVLLEMGGKNPLIVMEDADLDEAVDLAIKGAFGQAGQACTATGRVLVHSSVLEPFKAKLIRQTQALKVGNGLIEGIDMGPQINDNERNSTLELIDSAVKEGAQILAGGDVPLSTEHKYGYFVNPTVIGGVTPSMRIAKEEVFGPVLSILEIENLDDAIKLANDIEYGLTAAICTKNLDYIIHATNEIEAGLVKVNMTTTGTFFQAPFGGYKGSSLGTYKELGREGVDFYCKNKTVYIKSDLY